LNLTPEELAKRWQMSEGTLRNWRSWGQGPKYLRIGGRVRYELTEIEQWERKNLIKPKVRKRKAMRWGSGIARRLKHAND
jgi:predicted DNA-binding transcriptional regulator AlpA